MLDNNLNYSNNYRKKIKWVTDGPFPALFLVAVILISSLPPSSPFSQLNCSIIKMCEHLGWEELCFIIVKQMPFTGGKTRAMNSQMWWGQWQTGATIVQQLLGTCWCERGFSIQWVSEKTLLLVWIVYNKPRGDSCVCHKNNQIFSYFYVNLFLMGLAMILWAVLKCDKYEWCHSSD